MIFTIINVCLKTIFEASISFPWQNMMMVFNLYFLQLYILYKYWYFIPLFTKETYLSVADSLFIINYEMMKIIRPVETFYPGCMAVVRWECKFFIWKLSSRRSSVPSLTSMASDVTRMLFGVTLLLLNLIIITIINVRN